jgi:hypothetical protein
VLGPPEQIFTPVSCCFRFRRIIGPGEYRVSIEGESEVVLPL